MLAFHSAEVGVGSKVSVAVIVKAEFAKTKDSVTVQLGGVDVDFEIAEIEGVTEYVAIAIYDISAADLLKVITVAIDGATLTYSVPTYAYNMQNKGGNDNLVAIVQALYAYATAAAEYAK